MNKTLLLLFLAFSPSLLSAGSMFGGGFVSGDDGYAGMNFFAEYSWEEGEGEYYYLSPSFDTYESDSSERYSTYALSAGMDADSASMGGELFVQPETDGYSKSGVSAYFTYYPQFPPPPAFLSFGLFAALTAHEDIYSSTETTSSGGFPFSTQQQTVERESAFRLRQYDLGISVSGGISVASLSASFSKTFYDEDITSIDRDLPQGTGPSGYPDRSFSAKIRFFPRAFLSPELRCSRTYYLLDQPTAESYSLRVNAKIPPVRAYAGWEIYASGASDDQNYYSAGLTLSF